MLYQKVIEATAFIQSCNSIQAEIGFVLGTGLSGLSELMDIHTQIPYEEIPHFPVSTVEGHKGALVFGEIGNKKVVALAGRFHYYEGYSMRELTLPVRVLHRLGIRRLVISNVAGSVNEKMNEGDIVFFKDHINLMPDNPLIGMHDDRLGTRFPDMLNVYDRTLNQKAIKLAARAGLKGHEGIYLALAGPNLETPAEYKLAKTLGADLVGMSTVPEILVSKQMNLPIFVFSIVSNKCFPFEIISPTTIDEVLALAREVEPKLNEFIKLLINII